MRNEAGIDGGVKFWVYNAEAEAEVNVSEARTQKLRPVGPDGKPGGKKEVMVSMQTIYPFSGRL